jgi:hypothetical protein
MQRNIINIVITVLTLALLSCPGALAALGAAGEGNNYWIPVPAWLAGTWQTKFQTFLDSYDCTTGQQILTEPTSLKVARQRTIGAQQDATGQIWHYAATPYVRTSDTGSYIESQTIEQLTLLTSNPEQVRLCTVGKITRWSKSSRDNLGSFYERTVVTYTPMSEGVIKTDLNITDFDTDGKARLNSFSVCLERRVTPFAIINRDERGNLREKFLRFLSERTSSSGQIELPITSSKNAGER